MGVIHKASWTLLSFIFEHFYGVAVRPITREAHIGESIRGFFHQLVSVNSKHSSYLLPIAVVIAKTTGWWFSASVGHAPVSHHSNSLEAEGDADEEIEVGEGGKVGFSTF
jgi:hypothetical protein